MQRGLGARELGFGRYRPGTSRRRGAARPGRAACPAAARRRNRRPGRRPGPPWPRRGTRRRALRARRRRSAHRAAARVTISRELGVALGQRRQQGEIGRERQAGVERRAEARGDADHRRGARRRQRLLLAAVAGAGRVAQRLGLARAGRRSAWSSDCSAARRADDLGASARPISLSASSCWRRAAGRCGRSAGAAPALRPAAQVGERAGPPGRRRPFGRRRRDRAQALFEIVETGGELARVAVSTAALATVSAAAARPAGRCRRGAGGDGRRPRHSVARLLRPEGQRDRARRPARAPRRPGRSRRRRPRPGRAAPRTGGAATAASAGGGERRWCRSWWLVLVRRLRPAGRSHPARPGGSAALPPRSP